MKFFLMCVLTTVLTVASGVFAQTTATWSGGYKVTFMGVRYDDQVGHSTWFYEVTNRTVPEYRAISHVNFQIGDCAEIMGAGTWQGPDNFSTRTPGAGNPTPSLFPAKPADDPTTGIVGIKFDEEFEAAEVKYYYYTLDENYAVESNIVVLKVATENLTGSIDGPSQICDLAPDPAKIGDYAWIDANGNGVQDAGEQPLAGVLAQVCRAVDGVEAGRSTTDANGYWEVGGLLPAAYFVKFTLPSGYNFTAQNQGGDIAKDSDADPQTGQTSNYTLAAGEFNRSVDVGAYLPASLGNLIWHDRNNDGWVDTGEEGFDGVTVQLLFDADFNGVIEGVESTPMFSTTTSGSGFYAFDGLRPGTYQVIVPESNFQEGSALVQYPLSSTTVNEAPINAGNSVDDDNNGIQSGGTVVMSPMITLVNGEHNPTIDFGFLDPAIGNLIWQDLNGNGVVDDDEPGIASVKIELFDAADTDFSSVLQTSYSDANGFYFFAGLSNGTYILRIPSENFATGKPLENLPLSTTPRVDADNGVDDDNNGLQQGARQAVVSPVITLAAGTEPTQAGSETGRGHTMDGQVGDVNADLTVDFGFTSEGTVEIELSSFTAQRRDDAVHVEWTTESLSNVAGYHVQRAETETGPFVRLNETLIAVKSSLRRYEYLDHAATGNVYFYRLEEISLNGGREFYGPIGVTLTAVEKAVELPADFELLPNAPNPFNPTTTISYALPQASQLILEVYDLAGRRVRTLVSGWQSAGRYTVVWDARDEYGEQAASGMYLYRLVAGDFVQTHKMTLLK